MHFKGKGANSNREASFELTYYQKDIQYLKDGTVGSPRWSDEKEEDEVDAFRKNIESNNKKHEKMYGADASSKSGTAKNWHSG